MSEQDKVGPQQNGICVEFIHQRAISPIGVAYPGKVRGRAIDRHAPNPSGIERRLQGWLKPTRGHMPQQQHECKANVLIKPELSAINHQVPLPRQ